MKERNWQREMFNTLMLEALSGNDLDPSGADIR